jgi:mono/diheme cytochrome c family protein
MCRSNARPLWFRPKQLICLVLMAPLAGCEQDMADQPRYEALEASGFFLDGAASRHPPEGTVPRGYAHEDEHFATGRINGELAATFPRPVDRDQLLRGRERFSIHCSPCHDHTGSGQGMIVRRGFPQPPTYHSDRLRSAPVGHFFDVMTHGFGRMYDYAAQLPPDDRWAVAAYIRALQISQYAPAEQLSEADLNQLNDAAP